MSSTDFDSSSTSNGGAGASSYVLRYSATRMLGEFSWKGRPLARSADAIVRTSRGIEWATVLLPAGERTREYLGQKSSEGRVLRLASPEDYLSRDENRQREKLDFQRTEAAIAEHKLAMHLVDVERLFGGERLLVYYTAEARIDFRELVKTLTKVNQIRVEMRQMGIRDEAKLLADYGDCGKPVCCNTHLTEMPPVSMKMAKLQKATLDPTKISGRCGRLKCCLRYEYDTYEEYARELPNVGATVVTREGQGRVVAQSILARQVVVDYGDRRAPVGAADIVTVLSRKESGDSQRTKGGGAGRKNDSTNRSSGGNRESIADSAPTGSATTEQVTTEPNPIARDAVDPPGAGDIDGHRGNAPSDTAGSEFSSIIDKAPSAEQPPQVADDDDFAAGIDP